MYKRIHIFFTLDLSNAISAFSCSRMYFFIVDSFNSTVDTKPEGLSLIQREYIIDKDVAVIGMDNMLCTYHDGKQIAVHQISISEEKHAVSPVHYQKLTIKQSFDMHFLNT